MILKEKNSITWFEFEQLQPYKQLRHAIFSRKLPKRLQDLDELNLSLPSESNKAMAFEAVGMSKQTREIQATQVHEDRIYVVSSETPSLIERCDAFISNSSHRALCIRHADCQSALFFDPKKDAIAAVHCGWRGSCQNIYKKTIGHLQTHFRSDPKDLLVCISPSLGPDAAEFKHFESELPQSFWRFQEKPSYFNFWEISRWQLEEQGVLSSNIEIANMCTFENSDHFFSYRRDKAEGRNMSIIWLDHQ